MFNILLNLVIHYEILCVFFLFLMVGTVPLAMRLGRQRLKMLSKPNSGKQQTN